MLEITGDKNLIKVTEKIHGWVDTRVRTILYDLVNKKSKCNDDPWYDMPQSKIDWVVKYYLPKLEDK